MIPKMEQTNLPINSHREVILAALKEHDCIIVIGETGSGKTTALPRIVREAGFEKVCVTQPRRVAAIAAARRVAEELGSRVGEQVGYNVRFEHMTSSDTVITFATDGVLLRQAVGAPSLRMFDALVLDEAHERSLNTDVLFALAKRVLANRRRCREAAAAAAHSSSKADANFTTSAEGGLQRVVVASATLNAAKLSSYFFDAPVLHVEGRCFPVSIMRECHRVQPAGRAPC